jgi:hypothetical protein
MQRTADVSELQLLLEGIAVNLSLLLMLFFALGGPLTKHGATVEAVAMRGSRADCQTSTQVNSQGVVVCGELSLCVGVPDAEHGCSAVRAEYGTSSFYEWCDCRKPADIWDTGPCHSAGWQIGGFQGCCRLMEDVHAATSPASSRRGFSLTTSSRAQDLQAPDHRLG